MRAAVVVLPVVPAIAAGLLVGRALARPEGAAAVLGWWTVVLLASSAVLVVADRLARRLLPLAVLLELSLLFPERAPSRFRTALRSGSSRRLRRLVEEARTAGHEGDASRAAAVIISLVAALGAHHRPSQGHSERVRAFTDLLSEELRLPARDRHRLRWAALLHDVGKVVVPRAILDNRGPLQAEQWETIRKHPEHGSTLVEPLREWLGPWATAVEEHHERWDGLGYPHGLSGEEISLGGRVVCVADSFEAMTAQRTYQQPMSTDAARERLAELSGTQFDPTVVRAFLNVSVGRLRWALGPLAALAPLPLVGGVARAAPRVLAAGAKAAVLGATMGSVALAGGPAGLGADPAATTSAVTSSPSSTVVAPSADAAAAGTPTAEPAGTPPASGPGTTTTLADVDEPGPVPTTPPTTVPVTLPPVTVPVAVPPVPAALPPTTLPVTVPTVTVPTVTLPSVTVPSVPLP